MKRLDVKDTLADITGTGWLSAYIAARHLHPSLLTPSCMSAKSKTSQGPSDPVFDHRNPNPIINRATSTRQATRLEMAAPTGEPTAPASSSGSSPRRSAMGNSKARSEASKSSAPPAHGCPMPAARSSVLAPLPARVGLMTPTAASAAKGVVAPVPKGPPFGSATPRMPSHMTEGGRREHPPHLNPKPGVGGTPSERASPQAAPDYRPSPPMNKHAALPRMSAPSSPVPSPRDPPPHLSSTEPSEESDLGPFSTENVTEAGGVEDNESITAAFRFK
jgi:hypothetical protein